MFQVLFIIGLFSSLLIPLSILTQPDLNAMPMHLRDENISLSAEVPRLNLTYHSRTDEVDRPVHNNSMIGGDHLILKAEWSEELVNHSRLEVFASAIPATLIDEDFNSSVIEIDTRSLGNNASCTIVSTAWIANGSSYVKTFVNVHIGNYFVPQAVVTFPNGGEVLTGLHNITWIASDLNENDTLLFDVAVSSDQGATFTQLATFLSTTWFEWNTTGLDKKETYLVEVRVTDGIYFSTDQSDSFFTAGDVEPTTSPTTTITTTTTTTTNTNTTTTTTTLDPRLIAFVVILIISSSVMAVVVYYAARKWF